MMSDDIFLDEMLDQNDVLCEELPIHLVKSQIIKPNQKLELVVNKIKKKYARQRNRKNLKRTNARAEKWLKKSGYLDTSNLQTIDYNNDADITGLETVDYNNDIQLHDLDDSIKVTGNIDNRNLKKTSKAQIAAKKLIAKCKKINKSKLNNYAKLNKTDNNDVIFIKQVPVHPSNKFKKIADLNDKVEFIKQVPIHPRDGLKKLSDLKDEVGFIKQVPLPPRKRLERQTKKNKSHAIHSSSAK